MKIIPEIQEVIDQTGYKSLKSLMFLHYLVKYTNPNNILELGTGFGCSSIFMAKAFIGDRIISVDDYRGDTSVTMGQPHDNLVKCDVGHKVMLEEVDSRFFNDPDFHPNIVFMDASHNKVDLLSEYVSIEEKLPKDHIIVIDDLFSTDVKEFAVDLLKKDCYDLCFMPKFHDGMAVLSPYVFQNEILAAITKGASYA